MRRARASRTAAPGQSINIGIRLTRVATSSVRSSTTMSIVRNISGPVESDLDGSGSGALPGTTAGLAGDYQYQMDGIIATDLLEWSGADADIGGDPITVTLQSSAGNIAVFNFAVASGHGDALIYCSVNGTQFMTNASIGAP